VSSAASRLLRKPRQTLEAEWNAITRAAGARQIRIVNDVDAEEIPELPEGFQWLEAKYIKYGTCGRLGSCDAHVVTACRKILVYYSTARNHAAVGRL
jgi:hypothetical protein